MIVSRLETLRHNNICIRLDLEDFKISRQFTTTIVSLINFYLAHATRHHSVCILCKPQSKFIYHCLWESKHLIHHKMKFGCIRDIGFPLIFLSFLYAFQAGVALAWIKLKVTIFKITPSAFWKLQTTNNYYVTSTTSTDIYH